MRQETSEHGRRNTVWDDLHALYAEFGNKDNFDKLLDELSWKGEKGAQYAAVIKARVAGRTQTDIAKALGVVHRSVQIMELKGLEALEALRDGRPTGDLGAIEEYGRRPGGITRVEGFLERHGESLPSLLAMLRKIKTKDSPDWGEVRVKIIEMRLVGKTLIEVGEALSLQPGYYQ